MLKNQIVFKKENILLFFILLGFIVYFKSFNGAFLFDDNILIVNNPHIKHFKTVLIYFSANICNILQEPVRLSFFLRPVQMFTYYLNYLLGKFNPFGYHLINILLHSFNAYLAFLVTGRIFNNFKISLLTGIIFILHPLNIPCVSYISGRGDLLSVFFILLGILSFIGYIRDSSYLKYLISVASVVLALLSRENGLLMPLFLGLSGLFLKTNKRRLFFSLIPFILLDILYLFVRFAYLDPGLYVYYDYVRSLNTLTKILNFAHLFKNYTGLFLLPFNLHMFRTTPLITKAFSGEAILTTLLISLSLLLIYYQRKNKIILFSVLWAFFGFLPLWHTMFTRLTQEGNRLNMAESWAYLPGIGFCIISAYFLTKISAKFIFYTLFLSIMLFYGSITYAQQKYWIDPLVFYKHNLKFSPHHYVLWGDFISALGEHKYYAEAQKEAEKFIAYYPNNVEGYNMLAIIYSELGLYDKAKEQLNKSLKIFPFQLWARNAFYAIGTEKEKANALAYLDDSTKLSFQDKAIYYLNKGDLEGAIDACKQALKEEPTASKYVLAGVIILEGGKLKSAINAFKTALNLEPHNLEALINLSRCYRMLNMIKEALQLESEIQKIKKK